MARLIKRYPDNCEIEYDTGSFDEWCVYIKEDSVPRHAPRDTDYFSRLQELSTIYGSDRIYQAFVEVYNLTNSQIDKNVLNNITSVAKKFGEHSLELDKIFTTIYAGMVSEENKQGTRLGKRIKRLGIHQVLRENMQPSEAAYFSRGRNWREIDSICSDRGF